MTLDYANAASPGLSEQEQPIRVPPLVRGVRNSVRARFLDATELAEGENVDLEDPSQPRLRQGYGRIAQDQLGLDPSLRCGGMAYFDTGPGGRLLVQAYPGGGVHYRTSPDTNSGWGEAIVKKTPATDSGTMPLDVGTDLPSMFQGNGLLWILGSVGTNVHAMEPSGVLIDCGNQEGSPPIGAVDGTYMAGRVWLLAGNTVPFSKLLPSAEDLHDEPSAFDLIDRVVLSPESEGEPVALVPWRGTSLIAFFKNHTEEVLINAEVPQLSQARVLEPQLGCLAKRSVVQIGEELIFLDTYGSLRALRVNQLGTLQGVPPEPISEPVEAELPGRLNMDEAHRVECFYTDRYLYVFYPRDRARACSHYMRLHLARRAWEGPHSLGDQIANLVVSDIRGGRYEVFGTNGDRDAPKSETYQLFDGSYTDNGSPITYRETGRAWTGGVPEALKTVRFFDMEFTGGRGVRPKLYVRTDDSGEWHDVGEKAVKTEGDTSYPLNRGSYPLTYPLVDLEVRETTLRGIPEVSHPEPLPLGLPDLPLEDPWQVSPTSDPGRGRAVQYRVECETAGEPFTRVGLMVAAMVENVDRSEESEDL